MIYEDARAEHITLAQSMSRSGHLNMPKACRTHAALVQTLHEIDPNCGLLIHAGGQTRRNFMKSWTRKASYKLGGIIGTIIFYVIVWLIAKAIVKWIEGHIYNEGYYRTAHDFAKDLEEWSNVSKGVYSFSR